MNTKRKFFAVVFLSSLLVAVVFGKETPEVEPPGKIKARIAAASKAKLELSEDGKTVIGVKDRERKTFTIPKGVTRIGRGAFTECRHLRKVSIPDTVEIIGSIAFKDCEALKTVSIPKNVKKIGKGAFQNCAIKKIEIPDGITTIEPMTFYNCTALEKVTLPSTITSIGLRAFGACPKLKEVMLPEMLTELGRDSLSGASIKIAPRNPHFYLDSKGVLFDKRENKLIVAPRSLERKYEIPEDITAVATGAFQFCGSNMTSIVVHKAVTSIGDYAFIGAEKVEVSAENPFFYLDDRGVLIDKIQKKVLYAPQTLDGEYVVPEGMLAIGASTFKECKKLFRVKLPDGMQKIGSSAFARCSNLRKINLPDSITRIGFACFLYCGKLTDVELPANLENVEQETFHRCVSLNSIVIPPKVKNIAKLAFAGTAVNSVVIPDNVKIMVSNAFYGCGGLRQISFPAHISEKSLNPKDFPAACKIIWRRK